MASLNSLLQKANQNSVYHKELMNESYVNIKFSTNEAEYTAYSAGDTLTYGDETFVLLEDYIPSYNSNTCGYDYDMKFMAWYYAWENKLFKLNGYASEFTLTDKPSTFISLLVSNTGATISTEGLGDNNTIDNLVPFITLTFNGTNCLEALDMIVKALDPDCNYYEWWSEGSTIKIGKLIGSGSGTTLTVGSNVANVQVQKSGGKSIGKLYAYGSSRNLSRRYGATMDNVAATTEVKDSNGNHVGWQDTSHVVTGNMFKGNDSLKIYAKTFEYRGQGSSETQTIKEHTTKIERILDLSKTSQAIANNYNVMGGSTLKFSKSSFSFACQNLDASKRSQVSLEIQFGVKLDNGDFSPNQTIALNNVVINASGSGTISVNLTDYDFYPINNVTYALKIIIRCGYWNSTGFTADSESGTNITIAYSDLDCDVTSKNYAIDAGTSFGLFNPCFYPFTSSESRCFEKSYTGIPDNLLKYKCPAYWFPIAETIAYSGAQLNKRLSLDAPIDGNGTAEAIVTFDDIYPTTENTLGECSIKSVEEEDTNGEKTGVTLNYYTFVDANLKNISTDIFTEDTAKISFLTGSLAGMEFELKLVKSNDDGTTLCIIPNDSYGCMLPNSSMYPASGNKYAIIGIDISVYEQDGKTDLVADAKERLETLAQAYLDANNADQNVYTCTMICTATSAPSFGSTVTFNSNTTRVIGVQHPLDVPMADYQVTIGNSLSYKRLAALERKTAGIK